MQSTKLKCWLKVNFDFECEKNLNTNQWFTLNWRGFSPKVYNHLESLSFSRWITLADRQHNKVIFKHVRSLCHCTCRPPLLPADVLHIPLWFPFMGEPISARPQAPHPFFLPRPPLFQPLLLGCCCLPLPLLKVRIPGGTIWMAVGRREKKQRGEDRFANSGYKFLPTDKESEYKIYSSLASGHN